MPDKKQLSEEDIKLRYITPAITKKWKTENIRMEAQITAGRINLNGRVVKRDSLRKPTIFFSSARTIPLP